MQRNSPNSTWNSILCQDQLGCVAELQIFHKYALIIYYTFFVPGVNCSLCIQSKWGQATIEDFRFEQTASAVFLLLPDSDCRLRINAAHSQWFTMSNILLWTIRTSLIHWTTLLHHHFLTSFKFLWDSCSVTLLSAHYWDPGPAAPSGNHGVEGHCSLLSAQAQPFRVGVKGSCLCLILSFHFHTVYTISCIEDPVRIPLHMGCQHVDLL